MGGKRSAPKTRNTGMVSPSRLGDGGGGAGGSSAQPDEEYVLLPVTGSRRAGAQNYLLQLAPGTPLLLELDQGQVTVRHGTRLIGWLGGSTARIVSRLRLGGRVECILASVEDTGNEPSAKAAVRL